MTLAERAWQIWPLLSWAAHSNQIIEYGLLAEAIGYAPQGIGDALDPIHTFCLMERLPPLTAIVVNQSGLPGSGFMAGSDVPRCQRLVHQKDWLRMRTPTAADFGKLIELVGISRKFDPQEFTSRLDRAHPEWERWKSAEWRDTSAEA